MSRGGTPVPRGPRPATSNRGARRGSQAAGRAPLGAATTPSHLDSTSPLARLTMMAEAWAPTAARILLGLVLGWFGYHELMGPGLWTGYVPVLSASSHAAEVLVLAHGWVLLVLAVSLVAGIAPRLAAAIAFLLVLEIVISLTARGGLSDLVLRDVGVLGLCAAVVGAGSQRLSLRH
jgi:uncharacterized membrane protein YphA (DoxX/SURF4 family)